MAPVSKASPLYQCQYQYERESFRHVTLNNGKSKCILLLRLQSDHFLPGSPSREHMTTKTLAPIFLLGSSGSLALLRRIVSSTATMIWRTACELIGAPQNPPKGKNALSEGLDLSTNAFVFCFWVVFSGEMLPQIFFPTPTTFRPVSGLNIC